MGETFAFVIKKLDIAWHKVSNKLILFFAHTHFSSVTPCDIDLIGRRSSMNRHPAFVFSEFRKYKKVQGVVEKAK